MCCFLISNFELCFIRYPYHILIIVQVIISRDFVANCLVIMYVPLKGSKDGFCPLEKLEPVRKKMKFVNELHVIEGGDHSFKIAKKHLLSKGSTQEEAEDQAVRAIAKFVSKCM